jgi:AcrR family transcriptional regulator
MSDKQTQKTPWIETGYRHFAEFGPQELKIKCIAKDAGVSRTTFYHFFTDLEDFVDQLLQHHRQVAKMYHTQQRRCKKYTDLFTAVETFRTGIFFHRQLLLHKDNPYFYLTYRMLNKIGNEIIYPLWAEYFNYEGNSIIGKEIHLMLLDLWHLNLKEEDLTYEAFLKNANAIRQQIQAFSGSHYLQALGT